MNEIKTRYGTFIPYSGEAELRKKNKEPVTYHENGEIASIYKAAFPVIRADKRILDRGR